jgi:hypothetical protein
MAQGTVQRQIKLPLSKAAEIAYKSIRLRLARSLVVTSGIVLALAFLMSIFVTEVLVSGMRDWATAAPQSAEFAELRRQQGATDTELAESVVKLRHAAEQPFAGGASSVPTGAAQAEAFRKVAGESIDKIRKRLGGFPVSNDDMLKVATLQPALLESWMTITERSLALREQVTTPQRLEAQMKASGVPSTPKEIENNRVQKRWLVGLALLVAFVGILNAMLMSVTERFREIGTMKCLGALDSFIIKLFLLESLYQGITGTIAGTLLGMGLSLAAGGVSYGSFAYINLPWSEIAVYFGICMVVGVTLTVAGAVYPAWQAARMQPIEAMRVDT